MVPIDEPMTREGHQPRTFVEILGDRPAKRQIGDAEHGVGGGIDQQRQARPDDHAAMRRPVGTLNSIATETAASIAPPTR